MGIENLEKYEPSDEELKEAQDQLLNHLSTQEDLSDEDKKDLATFYTVFKNSPWFKAAMLCEILGEPGSGSSLCVAFVTGIYFQKRRATAKLGTEELEKMFKEGSDDRNT